MKPAVEYLMERLSAAGWGDRLAAQVPLAPYTTYGIGGVADLLIEVNTSSELQELAYLAQTAELPCTVLGRGSNVLVSDRGVRGLVIINRSADWDVGATGRLRAASGAPISDLAREVAARGWAGLEWAVGIPGSVGGAIVGNAGAQGGYISDCLESVTVLEQGQVRTLPASELCLGYRTSRFKEIPSGNGRPVILEATLALRPGDPQALAQQMAEWMRWRLERHPQEPSAGSVFRRTAQYPAGFLIDQAGLKGKRRGQAQVSPKHANFVVNLGGARASDVRALVEEVQEIVEARFGARLELEIELIGDW